MLIPFARKAPAAALPALMIATGIAAVSAPILITRAAPAATNKAKAKAATDCIKNAATSARIILIPQATCRPATSKAPVATAVPVPNIKPVVIRPTNILAPAATKAGGSGTACDGKYTACTCKSGYEWKNGTCQKEALNGAIGNICYCNNAIIGVKTDGMSFFVGLKDIGYLDLVDAEEQSSNYFCSKFSGKLPSKDQLLTIYNQKSSLNTLFLSNSGTRLTDAYYWSSTPTSNPYTNYLVDIASGTVSTMSDIYSSYYNGANVRAVTTCGLATPTCDSSYQYTCTGSNQTGGSGTACDGKYTACTCSSGYEWKYGTCQKEVLNGAQGDLYYCNGTVVGVKAGNMNFYVAMQDLGDLSWDTADSKCRNYSFCGNRKGRLPSREHLLSIYQNNSAVNSLLSTNRGTEMTEGWYWSSTYETGNNYNYYAVDVVNGGILYYPHFNRYHARPILTP